MRRESKNCSGLKHCWYGPSPVIVLVYHNFTSSNISNQRSARKIHQKYDVGTGRHASSRPQPHNSRFMVKFTRVVDCMNILDCEKKICCYLWAEEERILSAFTRRMIEIAAVAGAHGSSTSPIAAINAMNLLAIALDRHGLIADMTDAVDGVFDNEITIKDNRLFIRDRDARALLKKAIKQLKTHRLIPLALKPFIVRRRDKLPLVLRIWPFAGPVHLTLGSAFSSISCNY